MLVHYLVTIKCSFWWPRMALLASLTCEESFGCLHDPSFWKSNKVGIFLVPGCPWALVSPGEVYALEWSLSFTRMTGKQMTGHFQNFALDFIRTIHMKWHFDLTWNWEIIVQEIYQSYMDWSGSPKMLMWTMYFWPKFRPLEMVIFKELRDLFSFSQ